MSVKVEIFTSANCPYCKWAKLLLDKKGVAYEEIRVDNDNEKRQEMLARTQNTSVPQIFIDDVSVGGYENMVKLDQAGDLDALLGQSWIMHFGTIQNRLRVAWSPRADIAAVKEALLFGTWNDYEANQFMTTPQVTIQNIYLKDASFEAPKGPANLSAGWKPQVDVEMNTQSTRLDKSEDNYEVVLRVTITARQENDTVFVVEIYQAGVFGISDGSEEQIKEITHAHCPNILFPFARESIASLVTRGGFPQLLLGPMNFESLYRQKADAIKEQGTVRVTH